MKKPIFKPHYQLTVIPGEGVLMVSKDDVRVLYGGIYEQLTPLLDGSRDMDEIADALAGKIDSAKVYYALALLEKNGHLTESAPEIAREEEVFWHGMDVGPRAAREALRTKQVRVRSVADVEASPLRTALAALNVAVVEDGAADFEVVVTDDYLREALNELSDDLTQAQRPWLLFKPSGQELWIGPLFVPGKTGCYRCLATRLARNRPVHRFVAEKLEAELIEPLGALPATLTAAHQLAAVEIVKFLAGAKEGLQGKVLSLNMRTWSCRTHELFRNPYCRSCGKHEPARAAPVELVSRRVTFAQDGGHRSETPEQTLSKYQHLVSPITGVVTMLVPALKNGLTHVYLAGHNYALRMEHLDFLKVSLRNASGGKGFSDVQAKISALCEAIERYSAERTGAEVTLTASFREMRERFGCDAIHPNDVMCFSDRQLANREFWNRKKSKFNRVTEPLDESIPIDWTPVWSLTNSRHKYLPTQLLYFRSKASANSNALYCVGCSNGNASGNSLEEAVLQGFCELIERDAVALWWYNRLRRPGVALESFGEPYLLDLAAYYKSLGRELWALDITSDLRIPAFAAISRLCAGKEERILIGFGCHLDARIALQRAFAELNQMLGFAWENGDGELLIEDSETLTWLKSAKLASETYLAPDETEPPRRLEDYPGLSTGDLLEDIQLCRHIVEARGMEVLVLDQTRQDVKMPVVKVIVPGLRHFWARFGRGRLYDVPVQMGWLREPRAEEELNPFPIFF